MTIRHPNMCAESEGTCLFAHASLIAARSGLEQAARAVEPWHLLLASYDVCSGNAVFRATATVGELEQTAGAVEPWHMLLASYDVCLGNAVSGPLLKCGFANRSALA